MNHVRFAFGVALLLSGFCFAVDSVDTSFDLPGWLHSFHFGTTEPPFVLVKYRPGQTLPKDQQDLWDTAPFRDWAGQHCGKLSDGSLGLVVLAEGADLEHAEPEVKAMADYAKDLPSPVIVISQDGAFTALPLAANPEAEVSDLSKYEARQ
jgi:hypothetical protein